MSARLFVLAKFFASARMLGFALKFPAVFETMTLETMFRAWKLGTLGETCVSHVSGKTLPRFVDV